MKKFVKGNSNSLLLSLFVALLALLLFNILKWLRIVVIECTVVYKNPWQHYLSCLLYSGGIILIIFLLFFTITFIFVKKFRLFEQEPSDKK